MIKTSIRETENGHQISFSIGHQTFFLAAQTEDQLEGEEMTTLQYAEWHKKQLDAAFNRLLNQIDTPTGFISCDIGTGKDITAIIEAMKDVEGKIVIVSGMPREFAMPKPEETDLKALEFKAIPRMIEPAPIEKHNHKRKPSKYGKR